MVDHEEILKIATLSKLFVSEEELDQLTTDMEQIDSICRYYQQCCRGGSTEFDNINNLSNAFREDEVVPSFDRGKFSKMLNKDIDDGHFLVRKRA